MKTKYPEKEYLGIGGLPEFVKCSVELAYNPTQNLIERVTFKFIDFLDRRSSIFIRNGSIENWIHIFE
jgi:hypothetical protein